MRGRKEFDSFAFWFECSVTVDFVGKIKSKVVEQRVKISLDTSASLSPVNNIWF